MKLPMSCLLQNNFFLFTLTISKKSKQALDLMLVYPHAGKESATFKSFCLVRHCSYAISLKLKRCAGFVFSFTEFYKTE